MTMEEACERGVAMQMVVEARRQLATVGVEEREEGRKRDRNDERLRVARVGEAPQAEAEGERRARRNLLGALKRRLSTLRQEADAARDAAELAAYAGPSPEEAECMAALRDARRRVEVAAEEVEKERSSAEARYAADRSGRAHDEFFQELRAKLTTLGARRGRHGAAIADVGRRAGREAAVRALPRRRSETLLRRRHGALGGRASMPLRLQCGRVFGSLHVVARPVPLRWP